MNPDPTSLIEYIELITGSVAAFSTVVLYFVWVAYRDEIKERRADAKERAESHTKTVEALAGVSTALVSLKDQMIELKHQVERIHDISRS